MKQRDIFFFWLPLAISWLLMTFEGPWVQGVISRKPDAELQLAAFGLIFSLSVTIESPVIMLLATSSALSRDKQAFSVLWKFMVALNVFVTIVAALFAFTPLLDIWLDRLLGIPPNIIEATRPAMAIMILWSALIGYRRFLQGVLIRTKHTQVIGRGTVIRIVFSGGVALLLGIASNLPGAVIGAWALIFAVAAESFYTHWASHSHIQKLMQTEPLPHTAPLTLGSVSRFHLPLALTSLMTLLVRPVIESGLADQPNAEHALAAFPVIFAIMLVMRSGGMAWQEVVISLSKSREDMQALQRFTVVLGLTTTALMALLGFTPLIDVYIGNILGTPESLHDLITIGTRVGILIPLLTTTQSYLRALLMLTGKTSPIYQGMGLSFLATAVVMRGGVAAGMHGVTVASVALTVGLLVEMAFLWRSFSSNRSKLASLWEAQAAAAGHIAPNAAAVGN